MNSFVLDDQVVAAMPACGDERPHVVVVGAGFAGLACASALGGCDVQVTVIDRQNYHLFVPLLYQVATATLTPSDIAEPIRRILNRYDNIDVILGEVTGVDAQKSLVHLADGKAISYDRLVLATGSTHSYFGHDEWGEIAPGLKTIEDARAIRTHLLMAFEQAESCSDPDRQAQLMTTIIVGGGPTGVEMAGAIAELARFTLVRDFHRIDPRSAKIILVEGGPRLLGSFPETLSLYAQKVLERMGVSVMLGQSVERMEPGRISVGGQVIPAGNVIWAAGVKASPAARWLGAQADRAGRIIVAPDLSVPGFEGIYALGDTVLAMDEHGKALPGLAQVAKQQGESLGKALAANLLHDKAIPPFQFHNRGNTAIIGRSAAIFDFGRYRLKGWTAWLLWAFVHVYLLVGFENRLTVSLKWLWRYVTYQSGSRLIANGTTRFGKGEKS